MKKLFLMFICFISSFYTLETFAALDGDAIKDAIIPQPSTVTVSGESLDGQWFLDYVLDFARDSIFALMALIAIGMFLFIWWRLIIARWNPEEFKKAMLSFVYAAIGIFVVAAAWAIVRLVAGIDI